MRNQPERQLDVEAIAAAWCDVLGVSSVAPGDGFFESGGGSILALRLRRRLEDVTRRPVSLDTVYLAETFADLVSELANGEPADRVTFVTCINQGVPGRIPFFAAPGGWGTAFSRDVATGMDSGQPCWAFRILGTPLADTDFTLQGLAAMFVADLEKVYPSGPCILGGYSMGGLTAMEMAHQLIAKGREVPLLLLLDSGLPSEVDSEEPLDREKTVFWVAKQVPDVNYSDVCAIVDITGRSKHAVHGYRCRPYPWHAVLILSETQEFRSDAEEAQLAENLATAWREVCVGKFEMVRATGVVNRITSPPHAGPLGALIQTVIDSATGVGRPRA